MVACFPPHVFPPHPLSQWYVSPASYSSRLLIPPARFRLEIKRRTTTSSKPLLCRTARVAVALALGGRKRKPGGWKAFPLLTLRGNNHPSSPQPSCPVYCSFSLPAMDLLTRLLIYRCSSPLVLPQSIAAVPVHQLCPSSMARHQHTWFSPSSPAPPRFFGSPPPPLLLLPTPPTHEQC